MCGRKTFPSLKRRVAAPVVKSREATEGAQTGWSVRPDQLSEIFTNCFQYQFDVSVYRTVFKSDDSNSLLLQIGCPACFIFLDVRSKVRRTIQLNGEPTFRTIKIDNVATYAQLSPKVSTQKLSLLQTCPKNGFSGSL